MKRSEIQYCFGVALYPRSQKRGVALLGHQRLIDLHEAICRSRGVNSNVSFAFQVNSEPIKKTQRLDELKLEVGFALEYIVPSVDDGRPQNIVVDAINDD